MAAVNSGRMTFLRRTLLLKWIVTLFVWGLPALVGPPALFQLLGVPFPEDPLFVRLFGAIVTPAALLYWYAWKDPVRNVAVLRFGVLDNGLTAVTILVYALAGGSMGWFLWGSALLTAFFSISFTLTMPPSK